MQRPKSLKLPRRAGGKATTGDALPIFYVTAVAAAAHQHRRRTLLKNCAQIISIIVLLSLLIYWWFCFPVNLDVKDERVTAMIPRVVDLAFLAAATPPYASTSDIVTVENQTAAEPQRGTD